MDRANLKISSSQTLGGGVYNEVSISGSGKIDGDLDCNELHVSGFGKFSGSIQCKTKVHISGSTKITGDLTSDELSISGTCKPVGTVTASSSKISGVLKLEGKLTGGDLAINGVAKIDGSINLHSVKNKGVLDVTKDMEADSFRCSGVCKISGLLSGDTIEIDGGKCSAKEVGGSSIKVFESKNIMNSLVNHGPNLTADVIEGDDIYLENTKAAIVRGRNIKIGKHCSIDKIEYSGSCDISNQSKVSDCIQI